jgi:hypothetical protein
MARPAAAGSLKKNNPAKNRITFKCNESDFEIAKKKRVSVLYTRLLKRRLAVMRRKKKATIGRCMSET